MTTLRSVRCCSPPAPLSSLQRSAPASVERRTASVGRRSVTGTSAGSVVQWVQMGGGSSQQHGRSIPPPSGRGGCPGAPQANPTAAARAGRVTSFLHARPRTRPNRPIRRSRPRSAVRVLPRGRRGRVGARGLARRRRGRVPRSIAAVPRSHPRRADPARDHPHRPRLRRDRSVLRSRAANRCGHVVAFDAPGTFVANNNVVSQSVAHLHVHVVPRRQGDGLRGFFWPRTAYADGEADACRGAIARRARYRPRRSTLSRRCRLRSDCKCNDHDSCMSVVCSV